MSTYRITVCSLPEYDELVAEIYFDDVFVGLLSQESGADATLLELQPPRGDAPFRVPLQEFEAAIQAAKQRLSELRKEGTT